MIEESILLKLLDYGIAGIAIFLLYKIANNKLTEISNKLDRVAHKIDELRAELTKAKT